MGTSCVSTNTDGSKFMVDFDLKLEKPKRRVAYISALTMGLAYIMGRCTKSSLHHKVQC